MIDYKLVGSRLQSQRILQGLTQDYVSEKVDITTVYLSKIENGHVKPSIDVLDSICTVIRTDISSVFSGSSIDSDNYQSEKVVKLFNCCKADIKPIVLDLLEKLSMI